MKIACADFTFPLLDHDHSLTLLALLGARGADIGLFEGRSHLWPSREFRNPVASGKRLLDKLDARGLQCADVFLQCSPDFVDFSINHPEPKRRKRASDWFLRLLDYALAAGSQHVTILPGVLFPGTEKPGDSWKRSVEELHWRVARATSSGLTLGVEPHIGSLTHSPEKAQNLVSSVEGLTLTLDYTHFTRSGISDDRVEPLCAHASHFHVRGARRGRLQTSFDENTIDYGRVLRVLAASGYSGWLGIEYIWIAWEHCNECDNVAETVRFRDHLQELHKINRGRKTS